MASDQKAMSWAPNNIQLAGLQTESRNPQTTTIDQVSTLELCRLLNQQDSQVPLAVEPCIPVIAQVIDTLSDRVRNGGRVFYIGAGTSGRLGVLDASEIPPTFSAPTGQFVALIAGGDHALRHAREGAEDDTDGARNDLEPFNLDPKVDSLIGIASSGRTPYVLGGLSYARSLGMTTAAVVCVSPSAVESEGHADYLISAVTGPEAITGSTRMKAGTVTKMVLNMVSTGIMIRLGKTYGNLMIDVKATNVKLKQRAKNILRTVCGDSCTQSDEQLEQILQSCGGSVKLAAVVILLRVSVPEAESRLARNNGVLARVLQETGKGEVQIHSRDISDVVLCVDAGGSSCKAVVMSRDGEMGSGIAGPCNVTNIGADNASSVIAKAVQEALDNCTATRGRQLKSTKFAAAWIGMAGYGRPSLSPLIDQSLSKLISLLPGSVFRITSDIDLLPISSSQDSTVESVVVVIAGTGSVVVNYDKTGDQFTQKGRVGGWGPLLGDDGSGYSIGREALRKALFFSDIYRMRPQVESVNDLQTFSPLSREILSHLTELYPDTNREDILAAILAPGPASNRDGSEGATAATTKRIAGISAVVLSLAASDNKAREIVESGVSNLADHVSLLVRTQKVQPGKSGLVLAGGMMQNEFYRQTLERSLEVRCGQFKQTVCVRQPAVVAAKHLLSQLPPRTPA